MPATPLSYDEVRRAVERRGDIPRVPLFWHKFYNWGTNCSDWYSPLLRQA